VPGPTNIQNSKWKMAIKKKVFGKGTAIDLHAGGIAGFEYKIRLD
jgi:hypothetical protein